MKSKILVITSLFFSSLAFSYDDDTQIWLNLTAQSQLKVDSGFNGYLEMQVRRSNEEQKIYEYLIRPAVFYKTDQLGSFFIGTLKRFDYATKENENRHWFQWSDSFKFDSNKLTLRLRQEHRDIKNIPEISWRTRLQVRFQNDNLTFFESFKPFLATELFYNLNEANKNLPVGLRQSRTAMGVNHKMTDQLQLEISYIGIIINNVDREDNFNHVLNTALTLSF